MREENAEQTYRSSEETKQGPSDKQPRKHSVSRETPSASHPSTGPSDRMPDSLTTPMLSGQSRKRNADIGSSNPQSISYGILKWLHQTPQEEPWNAVGCSRDLYGMENTNEEASNPTTRNADESKNSNSGR